MHPRPFPCAGGAFLCASTAGHCNFTLRKHCFSCVKLSFVRVRLHLVEKIVVGRQQRAPVESEKRRVCNAPNQNGRRQRSEEHTSELQSLMRISYAVFCLKKKTYQTTQET